MSLNILFYSMLVLTGFAFSESSRAAIDETKDLPRSFWIGGQSVTVQSTAGPLETKNFIRYIHHKKTFSVAQVTYTKVPAMAKDKSVSKDKAAIDFDIALQKYASAVHWKRRHIKDVDVWTGYYAPSAKYVQYFFRHNGDTVEYSLATFRKTYSPRVSLEGELIQRQLFGLMPKGWDKPNKTASIIRAILNSGVAWAQDGGDGGIPGIPGLGSDPFGMGALTTQMQASTQQFSDMINNTSATYGLKIDAINQNLTQYSQSLPQFQKTLTDATDQWKRTNDLAEQAMNSVNGGTIFKDAFLAGLGGGIGVAAAHLAMEGMTRLSMSVVKKVGLVKPDEAKLEAEMSDTQNLMDEYEKSSDAMDSTLVNIESTMEIVNFYSKDNPDILGADNETAIASLQNQLEDYNDKIKEKITDDEADKVEKELIAQGKLKRALTPDEKEKLKAQLSEKKKLLLRKKINDTENLIKILSETHRPTVCANLQLALERVEDAEDHLQILGFKLLSDAPEYFKSRTAFDDNFFKSTAHIATSDKSVNAYAKSQEHVDIKDEKQLEAESKKLTKACIKTVDSALDSRKMKKNRDRPDAKNVCNFYVKCYVSEASDPECKGVDARDGARSIAEPGLLFKGNSYDPDVAAAIQDALVNSSFVDQSKALHGNWQIRKDSGKSKDKKNVTQATDSDVAARRETQKATQVTFSVDSNVVRAKLKKDQDLLDRIRLETSGLDKDGQRKPNADVKHFYTRIQRDRAKIPDACNGKDSATSKPGSGSASGSGSDSNNGSSK